ncbi:CbrC family protein [Streptomyces sp. NPDC101221]|uniref:CbrC family protein n=1 Tax=Streptomyces sp. NPDC101221 TaxID=3366132 RepID=UPI003829F135
MNKITTGAVNLEPSRAPDWSPSGEINMLGRIGSAGTSSASGWPPDRDWSGVFGGPEAVRRRHLIPYFPGGQTALHGTSRRGHRRAEQEAAMSADLPFFRYHPDPLASGSIRASAESCACCGRSTGWIYTATFYSAQEVSGRFCPWCIADGSAAQRCARNRVRQRQVVRS